MVGGAYVGSAASRRRLPRSEAAPRNDGRKRPRWPWLCFYAYHVAAAAAAAASRARCIIAAALIDGSAGWW